LVSLAILIACDDDNSLEPQPEQGGGGQQIFRSETFGNEPFWTDSLRLHEVIESSVSPTAALGLGLKVDIDRLPPAFLEGADLNSPATTVELLRRDAVIGLKATVIGSGSQEVHIKQIGVTCALCHSTVDNSVMPGIGRRLDGWPNRDLDAGRIIASSPVFDTQPQVRALLQSWGPGKYDAYFNHDGINGPVLIPPAYGLSDVAVETYTGEGPISYWNAYVAVTQMHGQGSFSDPKLGIDIDASPDLVTPKLPALRQYQLSLAAPAPPAGSYDPVGAAEGEVVFNGVAQCASCHVPPAFTDAASTLHDPSETGMEAVRASRGTNNQYRTTPLRGAWQHPPYFHDGSAATLADVVEHYDVTLKLGLSPKQKSDLVEFLKSL
jgi:mono/diheme cytochrome c family protein